VADAGSTWLRADLAREVAALVPTDRFQRGDELIELVDELAEGAAGRSVGLHPEVSRLVPVRSDGRPISEHVTDRLLTSAAVLEEELALQRWGASHAEPAEAQPAAGRNDDLGTPQRIRRLLRGSLRVFWSLS
jgi:hypothetical protein